MTRTSALKNFVPGITALKTTASALVLGATLVSCTSTGGDRPSSYSAKAEKALAKGHADKAVANAESAVIADPRNPAYRASLGQSYLASGRFLSAQRSFEDAIELGDESPRNVISLALAQIANGDSRNAQSTLLHYRDMIPGSDYGLALALAGDTRQGVSILENEVRSGANSAKVRQNLAMTYALDGKWREARTMVAQDVDPAEVDSRILQWVQMARPESYQQRVAFLLGVTPSVDAGLPSRLALSNTPEMADAIADIAAPQGKMTDTASYDSESEKIVQFAMADESDVSVAPLIEAMQTPVKTPVKVATLAQPVSGMGDYVPSAKRAPIVDDINAVMPANVAKSVIKAVLPGAKASPVTNGAYIVQLGAFSSAANADRAWGIYSKRHGSLNGFSYAQSSVKSKGRTLYRLAATGFGNAEAAMSMCQGIKSSGGNCIVRQVGNSSPIRMAAK